MHNGDVGTAPIVDNIDVGGPVSLRPADGYVENAPKDMVTALPGQVTRIKATFDKPGKYVWHCHILSHEDHEMMRVMRVITVKFGSRKTKTIKRNGAACGRPCFQCGSIDKNFH